ncbi:MULTISPECIES: BON domain-containing protein [Burkholderia]|uniref:BON domain-containing protein n=1 Tax=Burkholderia contaminans TaxID=488447 RepID=A0A2S5E343_9BURK|nr:MULTISPECIES: BON domain-containing protein [Burkholderia]EKS9799095.1 BON domain-containing protein [Burkholderia cepacia]EKS9806049.1 BON domain-containing protein [Burkholderia cepacia]EKS9813597.1 BON domain-containing protein [Burkholderia cepacia]EKS9822578.1 BON domain-containing protein [Burkholderia cepacia]EKS9827981.1 BON domain-containing protein [Burkholderia cepacia]
MNILKKSVACNMLAIAACCTALTPALAQSDAPAGPSSAPVATAAPAASVVKQRKAADRKLMRRVSAALARTQGLNATRVLVRVRDGVVTLAGSVSDTGQAALAAEAARGVDGVVSVVNQLRIDSQPL